MIKKISSLLVMSTLIATSAFASSQPFTESDFKKAVENRESFIVAFHSPSCGSCKVQKPNLELALNEKPLENVTGLMADFDSTAELRKSFAKPVRGPSTIVIFKSGKEVARILGETNKEKIKQSIEEAFAKN